MFNHIGRKIQITAKVICWVGIVCSVVAGLVLLGYGVTEIGWSMARGLTLVVGGVASALLGSLISWVSSFLMIGFGILVEKAEEIADNTRTRTY